MNHCLIVETRDPVDHRDVDRMAELALGLHRQGCRTAVLLAENGVFGARPGVTPALRPLLDAGVAVSADRFALEERGIGDGELIGGIELCEIGIVVDWLVGGASVLWR
jgi:hypothetical protein